MTAQKQADGMTVEEFAAWNEQMVERYDIERYYAGAHPLVRWIEERRIRTLLKLAAVTPADEVLEVGCGAGHVLQHFPGNRRTGVDLSPAMLARARRRLPDDVTLLQASAENLPIPSGSFNVIVCTEVLEHVRDPRSVLAELTRVAAPGARIVVSIPNEAMIDRAKRIIRRTPGLRSALSTLAPEGNEWHLHEMDLPMLRRAAEGIATIRQARAVPNRLLPVRWVVGLEAA